MRRDIVSVPAGGWASLLIIADNPGIWTVHCHIDWHMAAGLILTFVSAPERLAADGASFITVPADARAQCVAAAAAENATGTHDHTGE